MAQENDDETNWLVEAFWDLGKDSGGDSCGVAKDRHWNTVSSTFLRDLNTLEALQAHCIALPAVRDKRLHQAGLDFAAIFRDANWPEEHVALWAHVNLFARLGRDSFELVTGLSYHLLGYALQHGFDQTKLILDYYFQELIMIRKTSPGRLSAITRIYSFLRDARRENWNSLRLLQNWGLAQQQEMVQLKSSCKTDDTYPAMGCSHCRMSLHFGGRSMCPWKDEEAKEARIKAKATLLKASEK